MLICPLCEKQVQEFHKRSHILPEWMYSDIYDGKHKLLEISRIKEKVTKKQKGIYGEFICEECEKETQKYDHYASLILTNRSPESHEYRSVERKNFKARDEFGIIEFERWENIDFKKFQKFVLLDILRSEFAGSIGGDIKLNVSHLKKILAVYRADTKKDDSSYLIIVNKMPEKDELKNQVILPYIKKQEGHHVIEFVGAGFFFNVYVSSHRKPQHVNSLCLKSDGTMIPLIIPFKETGLFKNTKSLVKEIKAASQKKN